MEFSSLKTNDDFKIEDSFIITPTIISDERGFFFESWNQRKFDEIIGQSISFCQDNHSKSNKGVLRGMHYQLEPHSQGKLVRCTYGTIYDVAVDIRRSSKTFGKWGGVKLSHENKKQLWIPSGFAHGFLTLSKENFVIYSCTNLRHKSSETTIRYNDETLKIKWPQKKMIISNKDKIGISYLEYIKNK